MGDPDEQPGFDITVRWDFLPKVIEVAMQRLPALADAAVSHAWAGLYEMTPDHNPIIGPSSDVDGFYTIAGFSGHGFQHAPAAGRILADLITGRDPQVRSVAVHARSLQPPPRRRRSQRGLAGDQQIRSLTSCVHYFRGTSRFISSTQFCTTIRRGAATFGSVPPCLTTRKRCPSAAMS